MVKKYYCNLTAKSKATLPLNIHSNYISNRATVGTHTCQCVWNNSLIKQRWWVFEKSKIVSL